MGNAVTATWTKQEYEGYARGKMKFYLRRDTPYSSAEEYFNGLLVMHGLPPFCPERRHVRVRNLVSAHPDFVEWRTKVAFTMNETLHCSIDPSFAMEEYFTWLQQNWNKHSSGA